MKKTEEKIIKGKKLTLKELPPDDPIYSRGFVVGGKTSRSLPKDDDEKKPVESDFDTDDPRFQPMTEEWIANHGSHFTVPSRIAVLIAKHDKRKRNKDK